MDLICDDFAVATILSMPKFGVQMGGKEVADGVEGTGSDSVEVCLGFAD